MIFKLRTYEPGDFETLYEIDHICFAPEIAYSRRELRNYLRFPGLECIVALNEAQRSSTQRGSPISSQRVSQIGGFCIAVHDHDWGHLVTMDVLPKFRRLGVGSKILAETERRLAAAGVTEIGLETATTNESAIAFWEKHGYRKYGIHEEYYPDGQDAYGMAKALTPRISCQSEKRSDKQSGK